MAIELQAHELRGHPSITGYQRMGGWAWWPDAPRTFTRGDAEDFANLEGLVQVGDLLPIFVGDDEPHALAMPRIAAGPGFVVDAAAAVTESDPAVLQRPDAEPSAQETHDVYLRSGSSGDEPARPDPIRPARRRRN